MDELPPLVAHFVLVTWKIHPGHKTFVVSLSVSARGRNSKNAPINLWTCVPRGFRCFLLERGGAETGIFKTSLTVSLCTRCVYIVGACIGMGRSLCETERNGISFTDYAIVRLY